MMCDKRGEVPPSSKLALLARLFPGVEPHGMEEPSGRPWLLSLGGPEVTLTGCAQDAHGGRILNTDYVAGLKAQVPRALSRQGIPSASCHLP